MQRFAKGERDDAVRYVWGSPDVAKQSAMMDFECPGHRFSIPTSSDEDGGYSACRICEVGEFELDMAEESGLYILLRDLCPVGQAVPAIFAELLEMPFAGEGEIERRRGMFFSESA